jgi:hypothetical protein
VAIEWLRMDSDGYRFDPARFASLAVPALLLVSTGCCAGGSMHCG